MTAITYWHSRDGGPWQRCEVGPRSIVSWNLGQIAEGDIYDDGYGNRYRWERTSAR